MLSPATFPWVMESPKQSTLMLRGWHEINKTERKNKNIKVFVFILMLFLPRNKAGSDKGLKEMTFRTFPSGHASRAT